MKDRSKKILDWCKQGNGQITISDFLLIATKTLGIVAPATGKPYKGPRAMASGISASWREVQHELGDDEAEHISITFVDPGPNGDLVWKKYQ
jgi:hypothetical protein